jgi:hypothetical protein
VFRFIIEYSSLVDFGPYVIFGPFFQFCQVGGLAINHPEEE